MEVHYVAFTHQWIRYKHSNDMFPWILNFGFHHFPTTNCRYAAKFVDFLLIIFSLTPASNEDEKFPAIYYSSVFRIITYTVLHIFRQVLFGVGNQGNHKYFENSLLSYKCWLIFIGMKQKEILFFEKKISKWPTEKNWDFQLPPILNIFSWKFHGLFLGLVALMWLNLYGREAVLHKLKKG